MKHAWNIGTAAVLAFLASGCSDDGDGTKSTTGGTGGTGGGVAGSGGQAGAGGSAGSGGAPSCDGTESTDEKFSKVMQALRDSVGGKVPGGAIAVVKDGKLVNLGVAGSKRGGGVCDPITPDTLFRTNRATHLLTGIASLDAVEDGKLSLTDPITEVVPTLTVSNADPQHHAWPITLHHLLTGSSMYWQESTCSTLAFAFLTATNPVLWGKPGSMHWRNEFGFEIAGLALENVDKKPFAQAVNERVLTPLAMGGAFDTASIEASDHSAGHDAPDVEVAIDADCPSRDPESGYHGSIRDMAKLAEYLTGGAAPILEPSNLDAMLSKQGPHFFTNEYPGYGVEAVITVDGDNLFVTGGGWGFSGLFIIFTQRRLAVIALSNASKGFDDLKLISDVARIYDDTIEPLVGNVPYPPDPESLPSLVGTYTDDLGFKGIKRTLKVFPDPTDSKKLAGTLTELNGAPVPVSFEGYSSADNFSLVRGFSTVSARFWRDDAGNGSAVSLDPDGANAGPPFYRVP